MKTMCGCVVRRVAALAAVLLCLIAPGAAHGGPAIAIFNDPAFPYFDAPNLSGPDMQAWFARLGVKADLLDADKLADPRILNTRNYAALVCLPGNTFPSIAAENLRRFHTHGGGLVSTGVPFCHPCRQTGARGWTWAINGRDTAEITPEAAHSGSYGVRIVKAGVSWSGMILGSRIPARPGETFTLGGWARTRDRNGSPQTDAILLRSFDASGRFLGQTGPDLPPSGPGWSFVSAKVTTPPGTASVDVIVVLWKAPASVWLDDLVLVRGELRPGAPNLLPNPGFEQAGGEWTDLGHVECFGHDKIGTGGFHNTGRPTDFVYHAGADPLGLQALGWEARRRAVLAARLPFVQTLDPASLPAGDTVAPIVEWKDASGAWPVVALVRHGCSQFPNAIDVWAGVGLFYGGTVEDLLAQREVLGRAALYILAKRGGISQRADLIRRADAAYRAMLPKSALTPVKEMRAGNAVFPSSARPARHIVAADVSRLSLNEKLLLASLEGVINSKQPRLYLITDHAGVTAKPTPEERWLAWLKERGDVDVIERAPDPWSLLKRWPGEVKGVIITDPRLPASVSIATMMCGLNHAVMAPAALAKRLKLPVIADLRGRWKTNAEADRWAIQRLWPRLNHDFIALMWPGWVWPRDYIIAHRGFCFWISGVKDAVPGVGSPLEETLAISELLAKAPVNIGTIGAPWAGDGVGIQEWPGVSLLSVYGKFMVWSAETGNLSFHAGTKPPLFRHAIPPAPALDRSKVYLTFMVSDGDAPINWCGFFLTTYWDDPVRGTIPLAWSFGPTGADLMPDLMDYYYRKAGPNDTFVCACSGVGYCYPNAYATRFTHPKQILNGFLSLTHEYMRRVDERGVWTHSANADMLNTYAGSLPGAKYMLPDYGVQPDTTIENMNAVHDGIPSFRAVCGFDAKGDSEVARRLMVADIRRFTPKTRPAFLNAFVQCYPASPTVIKQVLDDLGPEYVPVLPEHLAELYTQAQRP
jgi:hypothetical protein